VLLKLDEFPRAESSDEPPVVRFIYFIVAFELHTRCNAAKEG
jgi:hypothetical protein